MKKRAQDREHKNREKPSNAPRRQQLNIPCVIKRMSLVGFCHANFITDLAVTFNAISLISRLAFIFISTSNE